MINPTNEYVLVRIIAKKYNFLILLYRNTIYTPKLTTHTECKYPIFGKGRIRLPIGRQSDQCRTTCGEGISFNSSSQNNYSIFLYNHVMNNFPMSQVDYRNAI